VRTLMRQDPDIIMVGEIRDRDTADMAVQAALTATSYCRRCTRTTRRPR
jgi:type II secretory ATPase GspE/PulE/Tfp pilus assembly ATPase PilB-like protein